MDSYTTSTHSDDIGFVILDEPNSVDVATVKARFSEIRLVEKKVDYIERMIAHDQGFPQTEYFHKYAPQELKDKYPEAGVDFDFFATRNEGREIKPGDYDF